MSVRSKPNREGESPAEPEHADNVPQGWVECRLGDLVRIQNGYAFPSKDFKTEGVPLIRQSNLDGSRVTLEKCVYLDPAYLELKPDFVLRKNDVLIGMSGSVGKLCIYDLDDAGLQNQRTGKVVPRSTEFVSWRFVWEYLKTVEQQLLEKGKGLGVLNVSGADIESLPFRLPPLAEQRRIVGKLELLLGKVSSSQQRLSRVPGLLKRFRQSVLAAACSGKLTADWREENPSENAESDFNPDYEVPAIPNVWKWRQIQEIGDVKSGKRLPKGRELVSEDTGHLYLRAGNLKDGTVRCDGLLFVPTDVWPKIKNYTVVGGDVYITIVGACIGDAGVIPEHLSGANLTENAAKVCNLRRITSHFLSSWLRSQHCQTIIQQNILSAAQGKLALFRIQQLPVPVPPLSEQQEIVRRVEKLFAFADQIEARLRQAQAHVDRLTQSLLVKAFRGELVPTEHALATAASRDYEPASALLERIRTASADAPKAKRTRRKSAE